MFAGINTAVCFLSAALCEKSRERFCSRWPGTVPGHEDVFSDHLLSRGRSAFFHVGVSELDADTSSHTRGWMSECSVVPSGAACRALPAGSGGPKHVLRWRLESRGGCCWLCQGGGHSHSPRLPLASRAIAGPWQGKQREAASPPASLRHEASRDTRFVVRHVLHGRPAGFSWPGWSRAPSKPSELTEPKRTKI